MEEGGGSSEMAEYTTIDAAADALDCSTIFHLVTDIVGFILFMHQQIPSLLQDITLEFDELRSEFKGLEIELAESEPKAPLIRRKLAARKREVKMGIRRLEKLMGCISNLKAALQLLIAEAPNVDKISLVVGPSPLRPLHIYELTFSNGRPVLGDFSRSKAAETLSRKAIRMMISKGVGSDSYAGPTKLFLLVKAPSYLNLPLHFLPKREFRPNRKTKPFRLRFRCRNQNLEMNPQHNDANSVAVQHSQSTDSICLSKFLNLFEFSMSKCRSIIRLVRCHNYLLKCRDAYKQGKFIDVAGFSVDTLSRAWLPGRRLQKIETRDRRIVLALHSNKAASFCFFAAADFKKCDASWIEECLGRNS